MAARYYDELKKANIRTWQEARVAMGQTTTTPPSTPPASPTSTPPFSASERTQSKGVTRYCSRSSLESPVPRKKMRKEEP